MGIISNVEKLIVLLFKYSERNIIVFKKLKFYS